MSLQTQTPSVLKDFLSKSLLPTLIILIIFSSLTFLSAIFCIGSILFCIVHIISIKILNGLEKKELEIEELKEEFSYFKKKITEACENSNESQKKIIALESEVKMLRSINNTREVFK